ncbi:MAG: hypothetical protein J6B40_00630 [Oscillospiraceae bacterium]|nr:hypothetical protein [Oscillospiraceae bacterium]MBQ8670840.1 hypothetical protein [Oscillospiraceae bacterium]MBQ8917135.1 hypothetical protein [Oscillospiraceae bacterium]MBQ9108879.1 hypothetical protein [Oscillospiraceae bacterium]
MGSVFESIMLVCFGLSWPISVWKSWTSKSTKGKSIIFTAAILVGYLFGIMGKILNNNINYVLVLYLINVIFVTIDFCLYFVNRRHEQPLACH